MCPERADLVVLTHGLVGVWDAPIKSPADAGGGLNFGLVPIGAASVSLPRDSVIGDRWPVISRKPCFLITGH